MYFIEQVPYLTNLILFMMTKYVYDRYESTSSDLEYYRYIDIEYYVTNIYKTIILVYSTNVKNYKCL